MTDKILYATIGQRGIFMLVERLLRFEFNAPTPLRYHFDFEHAVALYFIILTVVVIIQLRQWMYRHHSKDLFQTGLGYTLLFAPFVYTWTVASLGSADWQTDLPFHLPHIISFVWGLSLLKGYQAPLRRLYLLAGVTILFEILFPLSPNFNSSPLIFTLYYAQLCLLIVTTIHLYLSKQVKFNGYLLLSNLKWTTFILLFFFATNLIMEANYTYINHPPYEAWTPLLWLPSASGYYLISTIIATLGVEIILFTAIAFRLVQATVKSLVTSHD